MLKSASLRFVVTLIVSVLGFALTLCELEGSSAADSPLAVARTMPPPQR